MAFLGDFGDFLGDFGGAFVVWSTSSEFLPAWSTTSDFLLNLNLGPGRKLKFILKGFHN